jgi:hypothetical protein
MWTAMPFFQELVAQHGSEEAAFRVLAGSGANSRLRSRKKWHTRSTLSSEAAAMITGVELLIDAGYVL